MLINGEKMRLSYSLSKNIFEVAVGGLLNKLHLRRRRDTLFFEEILINFAKYCENSGYKDKLKELGEKWMGLCFKTLIPSILKKLSPVVFFNRITRKIWINLGLIDDLILEEKDSIIILKIKNESFSKDYEGNIFLIGLHSGVLSQIYKFKMEFLEVKKEGEYVKYTFKITDEPFDISSKKKFDYDKLNEISKIKGFSLNDALKNNIFELKNNRIYFRNKVLNPLENTSFHLIGNLNFPLDELPLISYNFFKEIVKESSDREKLVLLKTLLQTMGWGIVTIVSKENEIIVEIKNPPYGLQVEKDNWNFLIKVILGYMWLLDKNFRVAEVKESYKNLVVNFSK